MTPTYFFVDEDGTENVSNTQPFKHPTEPFWITNVYNISDNIVELPKGTIKALFHVELSFNDEPIKVE